MFSPQIRWFFYGALVSASLISVTTYALTWPDGVFGDYFTRMTGFCLEGGSTSEVLTGLGNNADLVPFWTKRCTSLKSLIGNIFGSTSAPEWQAIVGFKADGSPLYGDVNWHKDWAENISYTGAGNVGIGTDTPNSKLEVRSWSITSLVENTWNAHVANTLTNTANQHSVFMGLRARWSFSSPAYPQLGDTLSSFVWRDSIDGWSSVATYGWAGMTMAATENFDATHKGTNIVFSTTDNGNVLPTDKMIIDHNGRVGIGTNSPGTKLEVNGNIKWSNIRWWTLYMDGTNTLWSDWRMHIQSTENLYLNPFAGEVIVWGGGGPGKITADQVCIGADCRSSWWGGWVLINMYQCPGPVSLGGGAWGYYGCQNQIQNQPSCYEVEYPTIQTFPCTYVGKMRLEP